jgi:hypothetical protein
LLTARGVERARTIELAKRIAPVAAVAVSGHSPDHSLACHGTRRLHKSATAPF